MEPETAARAFLLARGLDISPGDLDRLVFAAVERLPRVLHASDPATDLTPPDREALVRGGFDLEQRRGEASPVARTIAEYTALLRHSKTVAELAKLLGVNESRIRQRLSSTPPTLYGFKVEGEWRIPAFILDGEELVPGISEVTAAVDPGIHPVAFYRWFTSPESDLTIEDAEGAEFVVSPREWLISGHPNAAVVELAAEL